MNLRSVLSCGLGLLLVACAQTPNAPRADDLFDDALFASTASAAPITEPVDIFAMSDAMRRYVDTDLGPLSRGRGLRDALIDALYKNGQLKLEYDSVTTRTAAQAFEARQGNCLSLVIMTAAFAKHLGVPVRYQSVLVDDSWSRAGGIDFASGHVNLALAPPLGELRRASDRDDLLTIDFLPARDLIGRRLREVSESTVTAMYLNNRAAEALADGRLAEAYRWARRAIGAEPHFLSGYNTLGVIYLRHGDRPMAQRVFERLLASEPGNTRALSNLARVHDLAGRSAEAAALRAKLAQLEPVPPFHYFDLGIVAMQAGDYRTAKQLFTREIERDAYYHEFHFWLAIAHFKLGETAPARKQLALAMESSTTPGDRALYAAKLDRIRLQQVQ